MSFGPTTCTIWRATGRLRFSIGLFGRVIVEIEETRWVGLATEILFTNADSKRHNELRWRKAKRNDVVMISVFVKPKTKLRIRIPVVGTRTTNVVR